MPADTPSPDPDADWLTSQEAATYTRLSLKTLLRKDADGCELGLRRFGRRVLFNRELLSKWMLAQKSAAVAAPVPAVRLAR